LQLNQTIENDLQLVKQNNFKVKNELNTKSKLFERAKIDLENSNSMLDRIKREQLSPDQLNM